jgi:hypothetical protein
MDSCSRRSPAQPAWQVDVVGADLHEAVVALLEFGDIWMMRKMLLNLRVRAEGASSIGRV